MRALPHWLGLVVAVLVAGCFRPAIQDGGFVCDPSQSEPCPSGLFCVAGICRTSPSATGGGGVADLSTGGGTGGNGADDMSQSQGGGGGGGGGGFGGGGGAGGGGGGGTFDLAHPSPSDMATGGGGSCAHSLCVTGGTLTSGCDPCVTKICAQDNYCCVTKWSSQCVTEVTSICNQTCP